MKTLEQIKAEMKVIKGQWDGDNAGREEDRANIAQDILDAIKNVEELLAELEENEVYEQDNI